jgi:hypothetical protein
MLGLDFTGYRVTSGTMDGKALTYKVKPGKTYGHIVSTTQYFQLHPIDIKIDSALSDTKQLEFDKLGQEWQWQLHLDPFTDNQQKIQPLTCRFPKTRLQDTITVNVTDGDEGQLGLVLDIV